MEDIQSLMTQLRDADANGDAVKAQSLADQIRQLQQSGAVLSPSGPTEAQGAPAASQATTLPDTPVDPAVAPSQGSPQADVDPVRQEAFKALREADASAETDPMEKLRAEEIAKSISLGMPKALKKADFTNDPEIPQFAFTPVEYQSERTPIFGNDLGGTGGTESYTAQSTLDENSLIHDPNFMASARIIFKFNKGYEFEGTDEELHSYALWNATIANNNFSALGSIYAAYKDAPPNVVKALLYNIDAGAATKLDLNNAGRAIAVQPTDLTNYIGGFFLKAPIAGGLKVTNSVALRQLLKQSLVSAAAEGAVLGTAMGGADLAKQDLEIDAGFRDTIDFAQTALSGVLGMGAGAGLTFIAGAAATALTKEGRQAIDDWVGGITVKVETEEGEKLIQDMTPDDWKKMLDAAEKAKEPTVKVVTEDGEKLLTDMTPDDWQKMLDADEYTKWREKIIDLDGNESAVDLTPGDMRSKALEGPKPKKLDNPPEWTTRVVTDEGEVDVPTWEKMLQTKDAQKYIDEPPKMKQEPEVGTKMSTGTRGEVEDGISELTKIVLRENFDTIPGNHKAAVAMVERIVKPMIEVFKRGQEDEIGNVLLDPMKSNDLLALKDGIQQVHSRIGSEMEKAGLSVKKIKAKLENSTQVTSQMLNELEAAKKKFKDWEALHLTTKPINDRMGSFAGLLLNHSKIVSEGMNASARKIDIQKWRDAGFTDDQIMKKYLEAVEISRRDATGSKQYRKLKREFFKAVNEGDNTAMEKLAQKMEKEEVRIANNKENSPSSVFDKLMRGAVEYYTNSLLANIKTIEINALSAWAQYAIRPIFAFSGSVLSKNPIKNVQQAWRRSAVIRQSSKAARKGARRASMDAWHERHINMGRYEDMGDMHSIPGGIGKVVRTPFRGMAVTDTYISTMSYANEVAAVASDLFYANHNEAVLEIRSLIKKADPKAKKKLEKKLEELTSTEKQRHDDFVKKTLDEAVDDKGNRTNNAAALISEEVLFRKKFSKDSIIEKGLGAVEDFLSTHPSFRLVVPFYRTPVRIIEEMIKLTPGVNMAHSTFRNDFLGKNSTYARDIARGKMIFATGMMLTTYEMANQGLITGGGPMDPQQKKTWMDAGNVPYRMWLPGMPKDDQSKWFDYSRLDPFFTPTKMIANIVSQNRDFEARIASGEVDDPAFEEYAKKHLAIASWSFAQTIKDMNMVQGVARLYDMFDEWMDPQNDKDSANEVLGAEALRFLQGFVPAFVRQAANAYSGEMVDPKTGEDIVRATLPGMRDPVNLSYTVLGKVRPVNSPVEGFIWSPVGLGTDTKDSKERYVYERVAIIEQITKSKLSMPFTHSDYPGIDLRMVRTIDNKMSLYDKFNRILSNTTIDGVSLEDALYEKFKTLDENGMSNPGNAKYDSEATAEIRRVFKLYRDVAWERGMQEEVFNNQTLVNKKTELDRLMEQKDSDYQFSIEQLTGLKR